MGVRLYTGFAGAEFQDEKKPCLTNYWDAGKADLLKDYSWTSSWCVYGDYRSRLQAWGSWKHRFVPSMGAWINTSIDIVFRTIKFQPWKNNLISVFWDGFTPGEALPLFCSSCFWFPLSWEDGALFSGCSSARWWHGLCNDFFQKLSRHSQPHSFSLQFHPFKRASVVLCLRKLPSVCYNLDPRVGKTLRYSSLCP